MEVGTAVMVGKSAVDPDPRTKLVSVGMIVTGIVELTLSTIFELLGVIVVISIIPEEGIGRFEHILLEALFEVVSGTAVIILSRITTP